MQPASVAIVPGPPAARSRCTVPLRRLAAAFEQQAAHKAARRWAQRLARTGLAAMRGGRWFVCLDAHLPDPHPTVREYLRAQRTLSLADYRPPVGKRSATEKEMRLRRLHLEIRGVMDRIRSERPGISEIEVHRALIAERGAWAQSNGISLKRATLYRNLRKLVDGEVLDGRGGREVSPEAIAKRFSPAAQQRFRELYLRPNKLAKREVWRIVQAEAAAQGWAVPDYPQVLRDLKRLALWTLKEETYARHGEQAYRAECEPKIARDFEGIPAGAHWEADGHTLDCYVRVPDGRGGWKRTRPTLFAIKDVRSRMYVGSALGETENTYVALTAFAEALRTHGAPLMFTMDHQKAGKAAGFRRPRSLSACFERGIFPGLFDALGIRLHKPPARTPWAKAIESGFKRVVNTFSRHVESYCGSGFADRPEQAARIPIHELPTIDHVRVLWTQWLERYHAEEHSGRGTDGLSPSLVMERYRGEVRRVPAEVIELLCSRAVGPLKVGRDGVGVPIAGRKVVFGNRDPEVWRLQGRQVWARIDPQRLDAVTLCDRGGRVLCVATNRRLSTATPEDARYAARERRSIKRATAQAARGRMSQLRDSAGQIIATAARRARVVENEKRRALGAAPAPDLVVKGAGLAADARKAVRDKRRKIGVKLLVEAASNAGPERPRRSRVLDTLEAIAPQPEPAKERRPRARWLDIADADALGTDAEPALAAGGMADAG